ncbi:MFS transporter [Actinoplanes awajinensis]|uniref:MFS transporter n=1 Tax=Actinoplanes awajinensis TaxID=135946 RepID=UPI000B27E8AB|nr:MFS transporter [Actinoplanes awajinensis]
MPTYRDCFATPQFTPLFVATSANVAAGTLRGVALAVVVYHATASPLLAALSLFGSHFAQVVGAMTLLSAADRVPPRVALVAIHLLTALGSAVLAVPGIPLAAMFVVIGVSGLIGSVHGGVRWGLLGEILPERDYLTGRSVFNMAVGATQIAGFAAGGALIALVGAGDALLAAAGMSLTAALIAGFGLSARPPRATGRASVAATWRVNVELLRSPERRYLYLEAWIPGGLAVGNEALFVPYRPAGASVLFIAGAAGMLAGDATVGRWVLARWRARLLMPLQLLLGVPYLLFALPLTLPAAAVAIAAASAGFAGGLILQQRIVDATPEALRGQAHGLHSAGMFTMQAVGASLAGTIAQQLRVGDAIAVMAVLTLTSAVWLTRGRRHRPQPCGACVGSLGAERAASPHAGGLRCLRGELGCGARRKSPRWARAGV